MEQLLGAIGIAATSALYSVFRVTNTIYTCFSKMFVRTKAQISRNSTNKGNALFKHFFLGGGDVYDYVALTVNFSFQNRLFHFLYTCINNRHLFRFQLNSARCVIDNQNKWFHLLKSIGKIFKGKSEVKL